MKSELMYGIIAAVSSLVVVLILVFVFWKFFFGRKSILNEDQYGSQTYTRRQIELENLKRAQEMSEKNKMAYAISIQDLD